MGNVKYVADDDSWSLCNTFFFENIYYTKPLPVYILLDRKLVCIAHLKHYDVVVDFYRVLQAKLGCFPWPLVSKTFVL